MSWTGEVAKTPLDNAQSWYFSSASRWFCATQSWKYASGTEIGVRKLLFWGYSKRTKRIAAGGTWTRDQIIEVFRSTNWATAAPDVTKIRVRVWSFGLPLITNGKVTGVCALLFLEKDCNLSNLDALSEPSTSTTWVQFAGENIKMMVPLCSLMSFVKWDFCLYGKRSEMKTFIFSNKVDWIWDVVTITDVLSLNDE